MEFVCNAGFPVDQGGADVEESSWKEFRDLVGVEVIVEGYQRIWSVVE